MINILAAVPSMVSLLENDSSVTSVRTKLSQTGERYLTFVLAEIVTWWKKMHNVASTE
jgi:hypothetical protein